MYEAIMFVVCQLIAHAAFLHLLTKIGTNPLFRLQISSNFCIINSQQMFTFRFLIAAAETEWPCDKDN